MKLKKWTALFAGMLVLMLFTVLYVMFSFRTHASDEGESAFITVLSGVAYQNQHADISLSGFNPNEDVTLWQTFPDQQVLPRFSVNMNETGEALIPLFMDPSLPTGTHALTAHGNNSQREAIVYFELTGQPVQTDSAVNVYPASGDKSGGLTTFRGEGYDNSEPVSVWITKPDGSVQDGDIVGTEEGQFAYTHELESEDPDGTYYLTGQGRTSGRTGIASFDVSRRGGRAVGGEVPPVAEVPVEQSPVEPTPVPVEPTPVPVEPTPVPVEPTPVPVEPTPVPVEPTPVPVEPTPAPEQPAPAPEQPVPPIGEGATLTVEPTHVDQLDVVTLTGFGFAEGETIRLEIDLPNGTRLFLYEGVTPGGSFREQLHVPSVLPEGTSAPGLYTFIATGLTTEQQATATIELRGNTNQL